MSTFGIDSLLETGDNKTKEVSIIKYESLSLRGAWAVVVEYAFGDWCRGGHGGVCSLELVLERSRSLEGSASWA